MQTILSLTSDAGGSFPSTPDLPHLLCHLIFAEGIWGVLAGVAEKIHCGPCGYFSIDLTRFTTDNEISNELRAN